VPRWLSHVPYVVVLCGVATGLAVVATGHFKRGSVLVGAAVLVGALARLVLPESLIGLLGIRKRVIDVLILFAFAVAIVVVAFVVPPSRS
jgi:hypothetical protein